MSVLEIFLIGVALSMDAFAVSISDGLIIRSVTLRKALAVAGTFGAYQFAMPVAGYLGASFFYRFIAAIDHWIAFALLGLLGGKMMIEAAAEMRRGRTAAPAATGDVCAPDGAAEDGATGGKTAFLPFKTLMVQGVATSIDALAVGISFAAMPTERATYAETMLASAVYPALLIGATTTSLCLPAVFIGKKTGEKLGDKAELLGGAILVCIGAKILAEHVLGA